MHVRGNACFAAIISYRYGAPIRARLNERAVGFFDIGNGIMLDIKQDKNTERGTKKGRKIDLVTAIINFISALMLLLQGLKRD